MKSSFSYVHVAGCSCSAPDYASRRALAIAWVDSDYPSLRDGGPEDLIPDGSCERCVSPSVYDNTPGPI